MRNVFLHGFLGTTELWQPVTTHDDICLGLPGHDTLRRPSHAIPDDVSTFEDAVTFFKRQFPKAPSRVVGYSMGARIALQMAISYPQRIESLVLIAGHPGIESPMQRVDRQRWESELCQQLETEGLTSFVDYWEALPLFSSQSSLPAAIRERQRNMRKCHETTELIKVIRKLGTGAMPSLWHELAGMAMPVHFVTGALDTKFTRIAKKAVKLCPISRHTIIPNAGHNPIIEATADPLLAEKLKSIICR